ncbi:MAG: ABC transporter substrate-binding protein [Rhizobiales bacterium]|nr:ABC transporter substrate-binding protein [Hyphomicrobiales bacterium]
MKTLRRWFCQHALIVLILAGGLQNSPAAETPELKIAVLKFGTVNWVMDVIKHHGLDHQNGFDLKVLGLASKNATTVAFLAEDVNMIVTDWFWVLRQRSQGNDVVIIPYSAALGAVMVAADSGITKLEHLQGKRIGVAGGPIDKSWLLLRAFSLSRNNIDLAATAEPLYAAPPLLNEQLMSRRVDAILNFWPYAARLEGAGYRRLASVSDLMQQMDMTVAAPLIGFTFTRRMAGERPELIKGFVAAVAVASELLQTSDGEWKRLRPLMKTKSDKEFVALRDRYREGILTSWTSEHKLAAERLFDVLKSVGGDKLTGKGTRFDPAMFWP